MRKQLPPASILFFISVFSVMRGLSQPEQNSWQRRVRRHSAVYC
ncbi:hypothetical protein HMPREF0880_03421 [Yokenella regensburgei ATCC 43003]|nr:hypothetical protein HMPREF0880_03421 [Yokenella regensburgei ATCC 43003]